MVSQPMSTSRRRHSGGNGVRLLLMRNGPSCVVRDLGPPEGAVEGAGGTIRDPKPVQFSPGKVSDVMCDGLFYAGFSECTGAGHWSKGRDCCTSLAITLGVLSWLLWLLWTQAGRGRYRQAFPRSCQGAVSDQECRGGGPNRRLQRQTTQPETARRRPPFWRRPS